MSVWEAAPELHGDKGESDLPGARTGHLSELFEMARLGRVDEAGLSGRACELRGLMGAVHARGGSQARMYERSTNRAL
jgi:hypothetical protein